MRYTVENTVKVGKPVKVFVNGNEIGNVIIADTDKGEVIYIPSPIRVKRNTDEIYSRTLRGVVTIEPIER